MCGDKKVDLGMGHVSFHCGIGWNEGIGKGGLGVFLWSDSGCGVVGIPVGGCGCGIGLFGNVDFG